MHPVRTRGPTRLDRFLASIRRLASIAMRHVRLSAASSEFSHRHGLGLALVLAAVPACILLSARATAGDAAVFPARPITIVVTFPPGGGTDLLARKLGERLSRRIGQPVLVENRPGASGNVGARYVAESAPDGHTLLMVNSSFAVNPGVFRELPFSPKEDFAAVINVAYVPSVLVVPASSPARTLDDWLAGGADAPPPYGSCGNGTPQHLAGEMLAQAAGRELLHVPYGGCGPALKDVAAGQVGAAVVTASSAAPPLQSGRLRALAVTSLQRSPLLPEVPTVAEQGYPGYQLDQWHGLLARAGTPARTIDFLYGQLARIMADPAMQSELRALGFNPASDGPAAFGQLIQADIDRFAQLSGEIGLQVD